MKINNFCVLLNNIVCLQHTISLPKFLKLNLAGSGILFKGIRYICRYVTILMLSICIVSSHEFECMLQVQPDGALRPRVHAGRRAPRLGLQPPAGKVLQMQPHRSFRQGLQGGGRPLLQVIITIK